MDDDEDNNVVVKELGSRRNLGAEQVRTPPCLLPWWHLGVLQSTGAAVEQGRRTGKSGRGLASAAARVGDRVTAAHPNGVPVPTPPPQPCIQ